MARKVFSWALPPGGVKEHEGTRDEMKKLLETLPVELSQHIQQLFPPEKLIQLNEIYLQRGQYPECIFMEPGGQSTTRHRILDRPCTNAEIDIFSEFFIADGNGNNGSSDNGGGGGGGGLVSSKRKGISGTLHRVALITDPSCHPEKVLGVTVRVGRAMQGLLETMTSGASFLEPLIANRKSLLIIGKPGVGKTTVLREIASTLSQNKHLTVVVVDKSKEIAGDGETPHPAIGSSRWMPVGRRNLQHEIMLEAVENQSPDVIIVDEISNEREVKAAQTIAQRGVMLIATVHGRTIPELIKDRERGPLVGGCTTVTLSGREAERRPDKSKQVLKRSREPVFDAALELHSRETWVFHDNIQYAVDAYLDKEVASALRLEPGQASEVACVPLEGKFDYCINCHGKVRCPEHKVQTEPASSLQSGIDVGGRAPFEQHSASPRRKGKNGKRR
jgi:stage III sporulation protein SpoIIIAA